MNQVSILRMPDTTLADEEAKEIVENAFAAISSAVVAKDAKAFADLYTPTGRLLTPGGALIEGRDAIEAALTEFFAGGFIKQEAWLTGLIVSDRLLVEESRTRGTVSIDGVETVTVNNCVVTHVRDDDGTWRMHHDIWNVVPS